MFGHDNQGGTVDEEVQHTGHGTADQPDDQQIPSAVDADTAEHTAAASLPAAAAATPPPEATDDLLGIKQQALQALTPLVDELDQTPEERFRTTMMMIQASDNHSLVKVAYDAAKNISSEKERAQALLDIVNEINYFTQHVQS